MRVATKANVRTTQTARTGIGKALEIAFVGGSVMELGVVGLGVLGLSLLMIIYGDLNGMSSVVSVTKVVTIITGFSFGPPQSLYLYVLVVEFVLKLQMLGQI